MRTSAGVSIILPATCLISEMARFAFFLKVMRWHSLWRLIVTSSVLVFCSAFSLGIVLRCVCTVSSLVWWGAKGSGR